MTTESGISRRDLLVQQLLEERRQRLQQKLFGAPGGGLVTSTVKESRPEPADLVSEASPKRPLGDAAASSCIRDVADTDMRDSFLADVLLRLTAAEDAQPSQASGSAGVSSRAASEAPAKLSRPTRPRSAPAARAKSTKDQTLDSIESQTRQMSRRRPSGERSQKFMMGRRRSQELLDDSFCNGTTEDVINMAASALLGMPNDARFDAKAAHNVTPASTRHRRRRLGSGRPSLTPSRQEANRVQEAPASVRRSTAASAPVPEAPPQGLWSLPWPRHQPLRGCLPANFDASAPSRPVPSSGFGSPSGPMRVEGNALQVAVVRVDSPSLAKSRKKALEPPVTYQPLSLVGEPRHDGSMRPFDRRLHLWEVQHQAAKQKHMQARQEKEMQELDECTFQPSINARSEYYARRSRSCFVESLPERLYHEADKRASLRNKAKELMEADALCSYTFQPNINPSRGATRAPLHLRAEELRQRREQRVRSAQIAEERRSGSLFQPKISNRSERIVQKKRDMLYRCASQGQVDCLRQLGPVEERLYAEAHEKEQRRAALQDFHQELVQSFPSVDDTSSRAAARAASHILAACVQPCSPRAMASATQPKRPAGGAYGQFMNEKRAEFQKELPGQRASEVAKLGGERWKKLSETEKAVYQQKYEAAKEKYDKDMEAFEAAGGVKEKIARKGKDGKVKKAKDPDAPKRPAGGAYGIFLAENRDKIIKTLPKGYKITEISKAAGVQWKALSEKEQKPYQEKYQKKNEEYKAAMEEYKKLHGKDVPVDDDEEEQEEPASKRARLAKVTAVEKAALAWKICKDSVYFQGPQQDFLTRQHTFEMAKQKRLEVRAQHVDSDCRFHPAITETSRQLVSNNLDLLGETPEERIHRLAVRDAERREQTRAELEQLHHKDCTFKPQINPVSEIIATSRAEASTSSGRVEDSGAHERLYRSAKIPAGSGDEWPSEYSFRPQLDPRSSKRFSHIKSRYAKRSELVETIRQEQEKKAEYLLERRRQLEEEKNADCTFAPRVKEIFQDNQKPIAVSGLDRFFELKSLALKKQQFSMADEKNFLQKVSWDGDPQGWPDFVRRVRLIFERTKRSRRHLLAPEIVTNLTGRAWNITQDLDHAALDTAAPDASAPESLEEDKTFPEDLDEDLDPGVRGDRGCSNSDDSTKALEELRLWESYEEAVEDV
ncbi:High mobility group protein 1-like [Symbiodinium microadriaticum]|uniref:High mobility group protein 1-like n=1 Tax=Symbiodinium microadriaticum TaxID=2951 RepID=A0A1Q9DQK6_SYMMI|nr:High mobility group protein 1-like [Symbiodinium microadriaticum]